MRLTYDNPHVAATVAAPASKSEAQRALICAALCDTPTKIKLSSLCDDTEAALRCIAALGADVRRDGDEVTVIPGKIPANAVFDCGESGAMLRFMLPLAAALGIEARFITRGSLSARPSDSLTAALAAHGVTISRSPLAVSVYFDGGTVQLDGGISSQYISGMLFALTQTGGRLEITGDCVSRPYIDLTLRFLRLFDAGIAECDGGRVFEIEKTAPLTSPGTVRVGGDWSGSAFCLVAGLIGPHTVSVTGLDADSPQGDCAVVDILRSMGGRIEVTGNSVTAHPSKLHRIDVTMTDTPDLVPPLACAACAADGVTRICGVPQLAHKESNRILSLCKLINSLGGSAEVMADGLSVTGMPGGISGGCADAANDHRIAMSAALLSLISRSSVILDGAEAMSKSFPAFADFISGK